MRRFVELYERLDRTGSTSAKIAALRWYLEAEPARDAAWGVHFLAGGKLRRLVPSAALRSWCRSRAGIGRELFAECYSTVGDLAETISLLIDAAPEQDSPPAPTPDGQLMLMDLAEPTADDTDPRDRGLAWWVEDRLLTLRGLDRHRQIALIDAWSRGLSSAELFVLMKMLTGAMRIGVSRTLVERALAELAGTDPAVIAHRLSGSWEPGPGAFERLVSAEDGEGDLSRPYPFFLASPVLPAELPEDASAPVLLQDSLGDAEAWLAEWKWDGIRAQLIRRSGQVFLWSRGDENLTSRFPEVVSAAARLATDAVLDGELVCWDHAQARPLGFAVLQRRIGRESVTSEILGMAPAVFIAYDLLEHEGLDVRGEGLETRRSRLGGILDGAPDRALRVSEALVCSDWQEAAARRAESRALGVEGLMLKRLGSEYGAGRRRGDWWKWKIDPLTIDAVLVYAQPGHGRRANLMTDYTFAVWDDAAGEPELVTVTKAYSGLTDEEFREMDAWIRRHTVERFGPVRRVEPVHVFELAFEGVRASDRHRAGVAFRFPRMRRWRRDKPPAEADTLATVRGMIEP